MSDFFQLIAISISGYCEYLFREDKKNPVRMVSGPTLPINIRKISITLPATVNVEESARLRPTVPNAEKHSNKR